MSRTKGSTNKSKNSSQDAQETVHRRNIEPADNPPIQVETVPIQASEEIWIFHPDHAPKRSKSDSPLEMGWQKDQQGFDKKWSLNDYCAWEKK